MRRGRVHKNRQLDTLVNAAVMSLQNLQDALRNIATVQGGRYGHDGQAGNLIDL